MNTRYDDVYAKCPFFKGSDDKRIACEGIADGCIITMGFSSRRKRDIQKRTFCDHKYENCELYNVIKEKYDE